MTNVIAPYWTTYVIHPLTVGIQLFAQYLGSFGLAIIAFTIFVKLLLLPLTIKATRSQKAMQALGPQLNEVKRLYANDRAKQSQETMRLYSENKVNPAGGCLPMLIQFPILIGLYQALYALAQGSASVGGFLWVKSLALPDTWMATGPGIAHNGLFILPLLAGLGQLVQQRMMMTNTQDPQQKMMNQIMQFMPLMIVYFGFKFPAGLALYWVTSTLFAIVQQYFITGWGQLLPGTRLSGPRQPFFSSVGASPANGVVSVASAASKKSALPKGASGAPKGGNGAATSSPTSSAEPAPAADQAKTPPRHNAQRSGNGTRPRSTASRTHAPPPRRQGGKR